MGVCFQHLLHYRTEGNNFLSRIVACDETWCHSFDPATKQMSMEWQHSGSPRPKKTRSSIRAGKVMLTCFFDENGPLMLEWLETGGTVNANRFCDTLCKLKTAIKNCRRGLLSKGVILLQDNARPHVASLQRFDAPLPMGSSPSPPYSPDLSSCDFQVFGPLKKALKGHRFTDNDEVRETVEEWFRTQPKTFFADGIHHLVDQGDTCFNQQGDYV